MKAPNENSKTKNRLLQVATDLMIEKGFVATTVDQICEAADVTKGAFFHYFKTKEALAQEAVVHFSHKMRSGMAGRDSFEVKDPLDRVYAIIDDAIVRTLRPDVKGCLVGTLAQEISESHENLRSCCVEGFDGTRDLLEKDLAEAKKKYAPRSGINPTELADHFIAVAQGAMLLAKARKNKAVLKAALNHYKRYLKSLFGR
jgi:TetR/AcrR family transcriptional repressor of nem operon